MGLGFGGQRLQVFPEEEMIAVVTGWDISGREIMGRKLLRGW